jgi:hypothetical protein
MCRSGASGGAHLVTFGARVRCVSPGRRSAVLARRGASPERTGEVNVLGLGSEQIGVNRLSQAAPLSHIEANC